MKLHSQHKSIPYIKRYIANKNKNSSKGTFGNIEGEEIQSCWNAGRGNLDPPGGYTGWGMGLFSRSVFDVSGQKEVVGIEYPIEGCGGLDIEFEVFLLK